MENLDLTVLRTLRDWRLTGRRAILVTVVRTWGSSPRPIGSTLALRDDGVVIGSVSGGCIEDDLIDRYTSCNHKGQPISVTVPTMVRYGVSADEAHRFGLPCGGTMELLLEPNPDGLSLADLVTGLEAGQLIRRRVDLRDGKVTLETAGEPEELALSADSLTNTFGPEYRMLLIGAGQLTEYLASMAIANGFTVTVCDPRAEHRATWSMPAVAVFAGMPDDVVAQFRLDRRCCVVALTHDPKLDDLALLEALHSGAFYVGGIGSRRNCAARRQRMIEYFDETEESLAHLRGPIGLYIGSKTPSEIATSVMAEILAVKNGVIVPLEMQVAKAKDYQANVEREGALTPH